MNDQDHSLSLSDPDRSLVLSHLLVNFLKNLVSCQTNFKEVFRTIFTPDLCTKICRDVSRWVQLCIEHNGGQFEHFQYNKI
jgi:hypothetical protein